MAVKIRLAMGGTKKRPFFKVVVADIRSPRDGRFIEKIGYYDPRLNNEHPNKIMISEERFKYWVSVGAQVTERVHLLASKLKLIDAPVIPNRPKKSAPKKAAQERAAARAAAFAENTAPQE